MDIYSDVVNEILNNKNKPRGTAWIGFKNLVLYTEKYRIEGTERYSIGTMKPRYTYSATVTNQITKETINFDGHQSKGIYEILVRSMTRER